MNLTPLENRLVQTYSHVVPVEEVPNVGRVLNLESPVPSATSRPKSSEPILNRFYQQKKIDRSFTFNSEQESLVREFFQKWHLNDEICLIDLLGLELHEQIHELAGQSDCKGKFLKALSVAMFAAYLRLKRSEAHKALGPIEPGGEFYFGAEDLTEYKLRQIDTQLPEEKKQAIDKNKTITPSLRKNLHDRIDQSAQKLRLTVDLFLKCWNSPYRSTLLYSSSLLNFSGSEALLNPKKDPFPALRKYMTYIQNLYKLAHQEHLIAAKFEAVNNAQNWLDKLNTQVAREIFNQIESINTFQKSFEKDCLLVLQGKLRQEDWYKQHGIRMVEKKSETKFLEYLKQMILVYNLTQNFLTDFQRILEQEVLPIRFPGYIPRKARTGRFYLNLTALAKQQSSPLNESDPIRNCFKKELKQMFQPLLQAIWPYLFMAKKSDAIPDVTFTQPLVKSNLESTSEKPQMTITPMPLGISSSHIKATQGLREVFIDTMKALPEKTKGFLSVLDQALPNEPLDLASLQTICFEELLNICRIAFICRDLDAMEEQERISEEFPSALADLIELEGIQPLLAKRVPPKPPSPPQILPVPAAPSQPAVVPTEKITLVIPKPSSSSGVPVKEPLLLENRNVRKVLAKLAAVGFNIVRTRGDHHILKIDGEGPQVVVPTSSKDLPTGTLKSIQTQANKALFRKEEKE